MAVEDDPAWKEWSAAFDELVKANEHFAALRALPYTDARTRQAWTAVKSAQHALEIAANKIEPAFMR